MSAEPPSDLKTLAHDLSNNLAAVRLWMVQIERSGCAASQVEAMQALGRLMKLMEESCERLRQMARSEP